MKIRTIQLLAISLIILWFIALFWMGSGDGQGKLWNVGLLLLVVAGFSIAQYVWWLYTSNDAIWPSGKTSLRAQSHTDIASLPQMMVKDKDGRDIKSTRSNEFLMFMGGLHRFSTRYTLPREVLFVNKDCLRIDTGDLVHNYIRSQPVWYRTHPDMRVGERPRSFLPMQFKDKLSHYNVPDDTPVGVAWEPIGLEMNDHIFTECLPYREQMEAVNEQYENAIKIASNMGTASTNIASTHEAHTRAFARDAQAKPTILERIREGPKEGDEQ